MIVASLGFVSKIEEYMDKETGRPVRRCHVASGESMSYAVLSDDQVFAKKDDVIIAGEVRTFERRMYFVGATIRLATASDLALFEAAEANVAAETGLAKTVAAVAVVNGTASGEVKKHG